MTRALLFDLDGTLIRSDPLHFEVFAEMMAERGRAIDAAFYEAHIHGTHNLESFPTLFPGEDAARLSEQKEARFRDRLTATDPMPGAEPLIARAEALGWAMAVVTNAPRANAEAMLGAIGLSDRIGTLVIGEECHRAKPDPAPYRAAMEALGVAPSDSIAFEDSASGVTAAARSGAFTVGIRSTAGDDALRAAGAHATISDFTDPALEPLLERLTEKAAQ